MPGVKPKVQLASKKAAMKTKTLVDALATLSLIPSFSTSDFGGDILPENVLVKNILEGMESSLSTLILIVQELSEPEKATLFINEPYLKNMKTLLIKLSEALTNFEALKDEEPDALPIGAEDYDADVEGPLDLKQRLVNSY